MSDQIFEAGLEIFKLVITALIYLAIVVNIFTRKGNGQLYFAAVLIGYFFISYVINDFFLATTFIAMWFVISGVEMFVSKNLLLAIFVMMFIVGYSNPLFFLLALILYTITTTNFLFSTYKRIKSGSTSSK
ncbi:MAG TPA: hypothetical protein VJG83_06225 [archaeon]|nr:hypothetical protein [archaeon]